MKSIQWTRSYFGLLVALGLLVVWFFWSSSGASYEVLDRCPDEYIGVYEEVREKTPFDDVDAGSWVIVESGRFGRRNSPRDDPWSLPVVRVHLLEDRSIIVFYGDSRDDTISEFRTRLQFRSISHRDLVVSNITSPWGEDIVTFDGTYYREQ